MTVHKAIHPGLVAAFVQRMNPAFLLTGLKYIGITIELQNWHETLSTLDPNIHSTSVQIFSRYPDLNTLCGPPDLD